MGRGSPLSSGSRRRSVRTAYCTGGLALALAVAATHAGGTLRAIESTSGGARPPARVAPTRTGRAPAPQAQPVRAAQRPPGRGDWDEPVRRSPAPIPRARPLPHYPPEPAPSASPSSVPLGPPDFLGSADGYLEIPVGQTATLCISGCVDAAPREPKIASVLSRDADRVRIRGLFPGQTLLRVRTPTGEKVYLVRVR